MDSNLSNLYLHRENQAWAGKKKKLPVTLVTGFLGAGKTTLLNYVLTNKHNLRIAAAVNDFAAVNVDSQIVKRNQAHDSVVELTNGCLCCTISGEFKSAVWNLLQDADIGKIDYLLIETSGVTDPLATIATLEEDYGKMYRIRLDSVVTVVDTDDLVKKLDNNEKLTAAADSQLKCADVVLLNKRDLVSEDQLQKAKAFVSEFVPGCRTYPCTRGTVPLHFLMEVSEPTKTSLVTHEVASAAYVIHSDGGIMSQERRKRVKDSMAAVKETGHIYKDEFSSAVFESKVPFSLKCFESFLGSQFPRNISRMKGTLWFAENRNIIYDFHMSGRQRYEITPQANAQDSLVGSFSVQIVAIGQGLDEEHVTKLLESCVHNDSLNGLQTDPLRSVLGLEELGLIKNNPIFEVVRAPEGACLDFVSGGFIDFRVTGVYDYGISLQEASTIKGIDFSKMNLELARRVNGSSGPYCLLPIRLADGMQVCRYSICAEMPFHSLFEVISEAGKKIVADNFRAVGYCKCGT